MAHDFKIDPYVTRLNGDALYHPLLGVTVEPHHEGHDMLWRAWQGQPDSDWTDKWKEWAVPVTASNAQLARRHVVRYVNLEATTNCNQACYFCPVSHGKRPDAQMSMADFEQLIAELTPWKADIQGVFLFSYNEPTLDKHLLKRLEALKAANLPVALNTNGSGFTPKLTDAIVAQGGIALLNVNLSTIDPVRYAKERGQDQIQLVLRNLDHLAANPVAPRMEITVLSASPEVLARDAEAIRSRFDGSPFLIRDYVTMNRAGLAPRGGKSMDRQGRLAGCDNLGSRVVEHIHIDPSGKVFICCQDYHASEQLGNWTGSNLKAILESDRAAEIRQQVHGMLDAPADFICRKCEFGCSAAAG